MTMPRKFLVDPTVTRWYHCISRCVRQAFLIRQGAIDRRQWIEDRLQLLDANFAISVGGFSVLDNHLHVLCRLDPDVADQWSDKEVVRRWIGVYPPKTLDFNDEKVVGHWVEHHAQDAARVKVLRERLRNLGWFMKALKEPLARLANKADGCHGTFWEARYKSIAILDEEALLATSAYIDLNPLAAGLASTPETSENTSISQRVQHVCEKGDEEFAKLTAARLGSVAASIAAGSMEQDLWLVPIEDRRIGTQAPFDVTAQLNREGMLDAFSLGSYILLLDYTARLYRTGKAKMDAKLAEVFERLSQTMSADTWQTRIDRMLHSKCLRGNFFATSNKTVAALTTDGHHFQNQTIKPPD